MLLIVSINNVAAAIDPSRYRLFAWLVVVGRLSRRHFFWKSGFSMCLSRRINPMRLCGSLLSMPRLERLRESCFTLD